MRRAGAKAVVLAIAVVATGAAPAEPAEARRFERIPGASALVTDGSGLAVWRSGSRLSLLRDDRRQAQIRVVEDLAPCRLAAAGARKAVFDCPGEHAFNPLLHDVATGVTEPPAGADVLGGYADANQANSEYFATGAIGRWLLRFGITGVRVSATGLFNWRTGELVEDPAQTARTVLTLDLPGGLAPLCGPLRVTRRTHDDEIGEPYARFDPTSLRRGRLLLHHLGRVIVRRCGSGRTRVLDRDVVLPPLLTARYAAWISGERAHAYIFRTRRHLSWGLPIARRNSPRLRATERRLFVTNETRSYVVRL